MDGLDGAWLELFCLEQKEKGLLGDIPKIQNATEIQRNTILTGSFPANASPIRNLPSEILLRIFDFDLHDSLPPKFNTHFHFYHIRDLAGTSRHWRALVLGCPRFWTNIQLTPQWHRSILQIHLKRSCRSLLDITVHTLETWLSVDQNTLTEMLNALVSHAHRWRSLVILDGVSGTSLDHILERLEHTAFLFFFF